MYEKPFNLVKLVYLCVFPFCKMHMVCKANNLPDGEKQATNRDMINSVCLSTEVAKNQPRVSTSLKLRLEPELFMHVNDLT